jgi:hypothetical protein
MTVTRVSHAIANGNTLEMPTHQSGDLLVATIYRNDSATAPTEPADWRPQRRSGSSTNWLGMYEKVAKSDSEAFGTWLNATQVSVVVYRHSSNFLVCKTSGPNAGTTNTITYGSTNAWGELNIPLFIFGAAGYRANNTSAINAPAGYTNIHNIQGSTAGCLTVMDTDGYTLPLGNRTVGGSSLVAWRSNVLEIFDTEILKSTPRTPATGIERVSSAIANGNTLSMPSHQPGDLLVAIAFRHDGTPAPSAVSGWRNIRAVSANGNGTRIAEKIAASANETFGTWTNASQVAVIVYRSGNYIHCGFQQSQAGTTDTVTFNAITATNYVEQDLDRLHIGITSYVDNNTSAIAAPTGMVNIANVQGASAGCLSIHDTDGLRSSAWAVQSVSGSSLTAWRTNTVEIFDTRVSVESVPPSDIAKQLSMRGGFVN